MVDVLPPGLGPSPKSASTVDSIESIGPMAELAGDGHRTLLSKHVPDLVRSREPAAGWSRDRGCSGTRTAPARRGKAACRGRKAAPKQLLHGTSQQIVRAQALDAALRLLPDLAASAPRSVAASGKLLHQDAAPRSPSAASSTRVGSCSERGKVRLQRAGERSAAQGHDALVARVALVRLHRNRESALGPDEAAENAALAPPMSSEAPFADSADTASASKRATARSRKSCVHCATSRLTAPFPCSCRVNVPRNFKVAASSTEAATAWPRSSRTGSGSRCGRAARARRLPGAPSGRAPGGSRR